jgi:integration host factor subunit alpha
MSLTKAQIAQILSQETRLPKNQSLQAVETLVEIMKETLASGEDVLISRFGKFCVKEKSQRRGRNPATGGSMMLPDRKVVTFKCLGKLRDRCNGINCKAGD